MSYTSAGRVDTHFCSISTIKPAVRRRVAAQQQQQQQRPQGDKQPLGEESGPSRGISTMQPTCATRHAFFHDYMSTGVAVRVFLAGAQ